MRSSFVTMVSHVLPVAVLWADVISASVVVFIIAMLWLGHQARRRRTRWIQARLQELEAYCRLEFKLRRGGKPGEFEDHAREVCQLVRAQSAFSRVALLILNSEGQMPCAGSCGVDELALHALHVLGARLVQDEMTGEGRAPASFGVMLDEGEAFMTIVPLRVRTGRLTGLLAVGADARMQRRIDLAQRTAGLPYAAMPVEMLAANLGRKLERRRWGEQWAPVEPGAALGDAVAPGLQQQVDPLAVLVSWT